MLHRWAYSANSAFGCQYLRRFVGYGLLVLFLFAAVGLYAATDAGSEDQRIIQPYEIYDARYCHITPRPFICERCLANGDQFVRILEFLEDGRPQRTYACLPYAEPYLR